MSYVWKICIRRTKKRLMGLIIRVMTLEQFFLYPWQVISRITCPLPSLGISESADVQVSCEMVTICI